MSKLKIMNLFNKGEKIMVNYLTEDGNRLNHKFAQYYRDELEILRKEINDPDYFEGWCIIDNDKYVKTLEDICGLLIYGYDTNAINHVKEFIKYYGEDEIYDLVFTAKEVLNELEKYFK